MLRVIILLGSFVMLAGCQTTPPNIQALQDQKATLKVQLKQAKQQIGKLEADKVLLQQDVAELSRVVAVLGDEKSSRVQESTGLRGQVRQFAQSQIDRLKVFLLDEDLVDYIGGEMVERSRVDKEPVLVVDLRNKVPLDGTLNGLGGFFQRPGTLSVKVLRPVDNRLVVVWSSRPVAVKVAEKGMQRLQFPVSIGVEKGDFLAYYFSKPGMVSYDKGTGDTRYLDEDIVVGDSLKRSSLDGEKERRAYSVGVFGLLNTQ